MQYITIVFYMLHVVRLIRFLLDRIGILLTIFDVAVEWSKF